MEDVLVFRVVHILSARMVLLAVSKGLSLALPICIVSTLSVNQSEYLVETCKVSIASK